MRRKYAVVITVTAAAAAVIILGTGLIGHAAVTQKISAVMHNLGLGGGDGSATDSSHAGEILPAGGTEASGSDSLDPVDPPSASAAPDQPSPGPSAPPTPTEPVVVTAPVVLAVGDSIMKGWGLDQVKAWPALLARENGWEIGNYGCNDAGFVSPGSANDCNEDFLGITNSLPNLHPSAVIIEGSSNDFGQSNKQLAAATLATIHRLHARFPHTVIIGLSTVWGDTAVPNQLADTNEQVAEAIKAVSGKYIDIGQPLEGHPELLMSDGVHPTAAGQATLATAIHQALMRAGNLGL